MANRSRNKIPTATSAIAIQKIVQDTTSSDLIHLDARTLILLIDEYGNEEAYPLADAERSDEAKEILSHESGVPGSLTNRVQAQLSNGSELFWSRGWSDGSPQVPRSKNRVDEG